MTEEQIDKIRDIVTVAKQLNHLLAELSEDNTVSVQVSTAPGGSLHRRAHYTQVKILFGWNVQDATP